jgi:integrase
MHTIEQSQDKKRIIEGIVTVNLWRDFNMLCRQAEIESYRKPFHTLRKSCITDWALSYPAHVVKQWAGHASLDTTDRYYLQVPESEYNRTSRCSFWGQVSENWFERRSNTTEANTV